MTVISIAHTEPALFGLLGNCTTKLSFAMHNAAFRHLGFEAQYVNFTCLDLNAALRSMRGLGITGFSVTIPHKEKALQLVDEVSKEAREIGAINTICNRDGKLVGENTDWQGITGALGEANVLVDGKTVLVLGAGGAACGAVYAMKSLGAKRILVCNRTSERAEALAKRFSVETIDWDSCKEVLGEVSLIVQMTSIGSKPGQASEASYPFSFSSLKESQSVFEAVQQLTPLYLAAKERSLVAIGGNEMILHQALRQCELFTGVKEAPIEVMREALEKEWQAMATC